MQLLFLPERFFLPQTPQGSGQSSFDFDRFLQIVELEVSLTHSFSKSIQSQTIILNGHKSGERCPFLSGTLQLLVPKLFNGHSAQPGQEFSWKSRQVVYVKFGL